MSATPADLGKSLAEKFSLAQTLVTLMLAVCGTLVTVGMFYGGQTARISSLESATQKNEQSIERNRLESEQRLGEKIDVNVYEADKQLWLDVKKTVEDIRRDQIEDLKARARR